MCARGAACRWRISDAGRCTPNPLPPTHTPCHDARSSIRACSPSMLRGSLDIHVLAVCRSLVLCAFFPIHARLSVPEEPITARTRTHTHTNTHNSNNNNCPSSFDGRCWGWKHIREENGRGCRRLSTLSHGLLLHAPHRRTLHPIPSLIDQQIELHCSPWEQRCAPVGLCLPPSPRSCALC